VTHLQEREQSLALSFVFGGIVDVQNFFTTLLLLGRSFQICLLELQLIFQLFQLLLLFHKGFMLLLRDHAHICAHYVLHASSICLVHLRAWHLPHNGMLIGNFNKLMYYCLFAVFFLAPQPARP